MIKAKTQYGYEVHINIDQVLFIKDKNSIEWEIQFSNGVSLPVMKDSFDFSGGRDIDCPVVKKKSPSKKKKSSKSQTEPS